MTRLAIVALRLTSIGPGPPEPHSLDGHSEPCRVPPMRLTTDSVTVTRWGVLVLSVLMLTAHICVLPTHGHVEAAPSHADGDHSDDGDESVHAASCEALPSSGIASQAVFTLSARIAPVPVEQPKRWVGRDGTSPLPTTSPPLFLLHAAFLI
jgi:hypothetical protein